MLINFGFLIKHKNTHNSIWGHLIIKIRQLYFLQLLKFQKIKWSFLLEFGFSSTNEDKMFKHVRQHDLEAVELEAARFRPLEKATGTRTFKIDKVEVSLTALKNEDKTGEKDTVIK